MEQQDIWKQFEKTGKVEDYLKYSNQVANLQGEEQAGETENGKGCQSDRYDFISSSCWGI